MSNTIDTTVTTAVNEAAGYDVAQSYSRYVGAAVEALTEREYALSDEIIEQVTANFSVSEEDVKVRLEAIGMAVRPAPEPEPEAEVSEVTEGDRLGRLEATVQGLAATVERLSALAERHLGSRV